MDVFRISKKAAFQPDGLGGIDYSGRWHEVGRRVVYASQSRSLAALEFLTHMSKIALISDDYVISTLFIPSNIEFDEVVIESLGYNWTSFKNLWQTQQIGANFLKKREKCLLKVPSAIVPNEFNLIINPLHPDFKLFKLTDNLPFSFDGGLHK